MKAWPWILSREEKRLLASMSWPHRPVPGLRGLATWGDLLAGLAPALLAAAVVALFVLGALPRDWRSAALAAGVVVFAALWIPWIGRRLLIERWRMMLRHAGYGVCVRCGQVMTGMADDATCPECGFDHQAVPVGERIEAPDAVAADDEGVIE